MPTIDNKECGCRCHKLDISDMYEYDNCEHCNPPPTPEKEVGEMLDDIAFRAAQEFIASTTPSWEEELRDLWKQFDIKPVKNIADWWIFHCNRLLQVEREKAYERGYNDAKLEWETTQPGLEDGKNNIK